MDVFELLDSKYDIRKQVDGLNSMIFREKTLYNYGNYTLAYVFERNLLRSWAYSMGRLTFKELLIDIDLYDYAHSEQNIKGIVNEKEAYLALQLDYNIILYAKNYEKAFNDYNWDSMKFFEEVKKKIAYIFDKTSLKAVKHPQESYYLIVPNDEKVKAAAERTDVDIAFLLYNYTSPLIKGHYKKKREILKLIANKIEPLIKVYRKKYTNGLGSEIFNNLSNLLNNFEIRHSNLDPHIPNSYNEALIKYTTKEWEEIYDTTYQLILDSFLIDNYVNIYSSVIKRHMEKIKKS